MIRKAKTPVASLAAVLLGTLCAATGQGASPVRFSGALEGIVTDSSGHPQIGAAVLLYNRQDKVLERALTNESGGFRFAGLVPDLYALRVSLSSYLPAFKDRILVRAGESSQFDVNLSTLFSSIQFAPAGSMAPTLMTDDWKWVLRTSSATRPVLRILPSIDPVDASRRSTSPVFSDTKGMVKVSAGEGGHGSGFGQEADLGTAFAFSTSLFGSNLLQFSGNVGYGSPSGLPSAGFRTTYTRGAGENTPVISLTMRQIFVPARLGSGLIMGPPSGETLPPLRTVSASVGQRTQLSDSLDLDYGFELDTVSLVDHIHYFSPYARLTYSMHGAKLDFTYTSGNARPELGSSIEDSNAELQRDLTALALLPRLSQRAGRTEVQRGQDYEIGYTRTLGSREVRVSAYREAISNAAVTVADPGPELFVGDLMPDLFSNSAVFNAGDYHTTGFTSSLRQNIGDNYSVTLIYGSSGVLMPMAGEIASESPDDLRARIQASRRGAVTVRTTGTLPSTGTRLIASYQWTDYRALTPGHLYSTQFARPEPGLNIYMRQPIPSIFGLHRRMEATADLRNLLAQGYLPLSFATGQHLLLVPTARSFRGGLSFTF